MKISLTLTEFPVDRLGALAAFFAGSTAAIAITQPPIGGNLTPPPATGDDDETSDTPVAAGTVDKAGLPHDNRIHSEPAKLTSKGFWRARRGVDPQTVTAVEAELRQRAFTPPPVQQQPAPQTPPQNVFPPNAGYPSIPANVQHHPEAAYQPPQAFTPPPVQQQPAPQPTPQPTAAGPIDFPSFMAKLQGLLAARGADGQPLVTAEYLANVTQRVGAAFSIPANAITDLQSNPAALQYATQIMASEGRWY